MRKLLITLIVVLIILAVGQGIYYKLNPNTEQINIPQNNNNEEKQIKNSMYIYGMVDLYTKFNPNLSLEELQNKMYNFVYIDLPKIYGDTLKKTTEEIKNYYKENNIKQSSNIYSEEDFLMIVKQLQNIYYTQESIILSETRIDTQNIFRSPNGLINFNITLIFNNERTLELKAILSEQDKTLLILSNSKLDNIFNSYSGDARKEEVIEKIEKLVENTDRIRQNTTLKTENEKTQYFDLNKEDMNNLGISTAEDFIKVANQINCMNWINGILTFQNYEINFESLKQEEDYNSFQITLYYNFDSKIDIIISIRNNRNIEPKIKISGYEDISLYEDINNNIIEE